MSLAELLDVEGIPVTLVPSLEYVQRNPWYDEGGGPLVLVSTSKGYGAETVRQWREGPFRTADLILVGVREPGLHSEEHLHVTRLPIVPEEFLELVHRLVVEQNHQRTRDPAVGVKAA